jgi:glycosyltransferase involved in cell wall biosynthesis
MKPKVSIALCTYNGEKFLQKQIDSYLSQTVLPDEIIICDDGSGDNTIAIIQKNVDQNPAIHWQLLQNKKTIGTGRNFEKAIRYCSGEFIFLSDQDDIWEREKIGETIIYFDNNPDCDASFSDASLIDEADRKIPETLLDNSFFKTAYRKNYESADLFYWSILLGNIITGATMAIRRLALPNILPFQLDLGRRKLWHDGWISLSLMTDGRVGYIDQTLMQYRVHAAQQVGVVRRNDPFEKLIMQKEYNEDCISEYFQRYLSAFSTIKELVKIKTLESGIEERITKEYLEHRKKYFNTQSFPVRKLRLMKWYLLGINYISLKDLLIL